MDTYDLGRLAASFVLPLGEAIEEPEMEAALLADLGFVLPEGVTLLGSTRALLEALAPVVLDLEDHDEDGQASSAELIARTAAALRAVLTTVSALADNLEPSARNSALARHTDLLEVLPRRLVDLMCARFLEKEFPVAYELLRTCGVVEVTEVVHEDDPHRVSFTEHILHWDRLSPLLSDPIAHLKDLYGWGRPTGVDTETLFERLGALGIALGLPAELRPIDERARTGFDLALAGTGAVPPGETTTALRIPLWPSFEASVGAELYPVADAAAHVDGFGVGVYVQGQLETLVELAPWLSLELALGGFASGFGAVLRAGRETKLVSALFVDDPVRLLDAVAVDARAKFAYASPDDTPIVLFGSAQGTRLEVNEVGLVLLLSNAQGDFDLGGELSLSKLALRVESDDDGGFVESLIGDGFAAELDLTVGVSLRRGLYLGGGSKLDCIIPVEVQVGPVSIDRVRVTLKPDPATLEVSATGSLALGPVKVVIEDIGLAGTIVPSRPGLLGHADLSVGFKAPSGLGLFVDAAVVSGGGFLSHDPSTNRYAGAVELSIAERWTLKGVGIVAPTPGGKTSVLAIATLQLPAVSPSFSITGVGAFVGTYRRGDREAFARGLHNGDVAAVLFPEDPVGEAPRIIAALDHLFPLSDDAHLFGLLLEITYGGVTHLIVAQLGLLLEISTTGALQHIYLLLKARLALPGELARFLSIEVDGFGDLDLAAGELELRMSLRDSTLLGADLSGDGLVLYYRVPGTEGGGLTDAKPGTRQVFISMGGYHPDYEPPARAIVGKRLSIVVARGDWFRLEASQYVALSPGAYHFGIDAQLRVRLAAFGLRGDIGFDALIGFDWTFDIAFHASLTLEWEGRTLAGASVEARLIGPGPTILKGKATVSLLAWDLSKSFCEEIGSERAVVAAALDVVGLLRTAVAQTTSWLKFPVDGVALRERARDDRIWASPGGPLRLQQQVVPLELPVDRVGPSRLPAPETFRIDQVTFGGDTAVVAHGPFASALFFEMTDEEKLAAVGFEDYPAGFEIGGELLAVGVVATSAGEYQDIVVDATRPPPPSEPPPTSFPDHLWGLAGALAPTASRQPAVTPLVQLRPRAFAVVDASGASLPNFAEVSYAAARVQAKLTQAAIVRSDEAPHE